MFSTLMALSKSVMRSRNEAIFPFASINHRRGGRESPNTWRPAKSVCIGHMSVDQPTRGITPHLLLHVQYASRAREALDRLGGKRVHQR